jgi:hypothetical protein
MLIPHRYRLPMGKIVLLPDYFHHRCISYQSPEIQIGTLSSAYLYFLIH